MSVRLSAWNKSAQTERKFKKFDILVFSENLLKNCSLNKIGQ
jgi:hypothetical protein